MILEKIKKTNDIKRIPVSDYPLLAQEIRDFLVSNISNTGGHLASNLGTVELTMALHLALNLPKDKIVWDVGHQAYTHKILTGRKDEFATLRQKGGLSGFPKRRESDCDAFDTGHSSTSISAGLGLVKARDIRHEDYTVVSVIGDGAMTGGMVYEAINNAGRLDTNFIIVLNDNNMSISENVGGFSKNLNNIRMAAGYNILKDGVSNTLSDIPVIGEGIVDTVSRTKSSMKQFFLSSNMLFENMGVTYIGPVDGHNINQMTRMLRKAKRMHGAVLLHVLTHKGKGYRPAEQNPTAFHGVDPFDVATGKPKKEKKGRSYTDVFASMMLKLGEEHADVTAITAAMSAGTGLKQFARKYPERFFDVGIAEEHAVTFAAGLAVGGLKPYVAIYSSFLQRAYDQILHDVCIQNLPVVFAIDRAGIVGNDGETHQGIFDLSYLTTIPNLAVCAPKNQYELADMLRFSYGYDAPIAIRYPRGQAWNGLKTSRQPIELGKSEVVLEGSGDSRIALVAIGTMVQTAYEAAERMDQAPTVVNMRFVKPLDTQILDQLAARCDAIVCLEENVLNGGFCEQVENYLEEQGYKGLVKHFAIPNTFVEHGNPDELKKMLGLDADSVYEELVRIEKGLPKKHTRTKKASV